MLILTQNHQSSSEHAVREALGDLGVEDDQQSVVMTELLAKLAAHHEETYQHSLRVGLLSREIARVAGVNERDLLIAGLVHDVGKTVTPLYVLDCDHGWNEVYQTLVRRHVVTGYNMLLGKLDWAAAIMVWHHKFQPDPYPTLMPAPPRTVSPDQLRKAAHLGRLIAIADTYDAFHRRNDRFGTLDERAIHTKMMEAHTDEAVLIDLLYAEGVLHG